jgi:hypothetical protein
MLARNQSPAQRAVRERRQRQPILWNYARNARKKGSHDRLPAIFVSVREKLDWVLHDNPPGRNSEGSTDAGNGVAMQIVVGVIARAGVGVSTLVNLGSLADFQRSSRIASAEGIEREIDVGEVECPFACHLPRAMTGARHRNGIEG